MPQCQSMLWIGKNKVQLFFKNCCFVWMMTFYLSDYLWFKQEIKLYLNDSWDIWMTRSLLWFHFIATGYFTWSFDFTCSVLYGLDQAWFWGIIVSPQEKESKLWSTEKQSNVICRHHSCPFPLPIQRRIWIRLARACQDPATQQVPRVTRMITPSLHIMISHAIEW